ncbi:hypothetical protein AB0E69_06405 [Kribbella sp. NPDC026611]|uniref:hypothetical protein n=1 Tax=Kribbella sp. NPDC026611 TaxID=3154911 RepID=UPI0033C627F1
MGAQNNFDGAASQEVQATIATLSTQIEALIADHRKNVAAALSSFSATGVSDEYKGVEDRFNKAADKTIELINSLKDVMKGNDGIAADTQSSAMKWARSAGS